MKINKLLFFIITLLSFAACTTEYVDYGIRPEIPVATDFKAKVSSVNAKYVGDTFEFAATLNGADVTAATDFKVNGNVIASNSYVPSIAAEYIVTAVLDMPGIGSKTATFKFTALKKDTNPNPNPDPEPEPEQGNRIEYNGNNPLNTTYFILNGIEDADGVTIPELTMPDGVTPALNWVMINFNGTNPNTATNVYIMDVLVPTNGNNLVYPFQSNQIAVQGVEVLVNGTSPFTIVDTTLNFETTGNSAPTQQANGNANYKSVSTGAASGQTAKLFWNGAYEVGVQDLTGQGKGVSKYMNFKIKNKQVLKKVNISK